MLLLDRQCARTIARGGTDETSLVANPTWESQTQRGQLLQMKSRVMDRIRVTYTQYALGILAGVLALGMAACDGAASSAAGTGLTENRTVEKDVEATLTGKAPTGSERAPAVTAAAVETASVRRVSGATSAVQSSPAGTVTVREARESFDRDQVHPLPDGRSLNCLMDLPGHDARHQQSFVEWRPDSSEILFNSGSAIYAVSPDGRRLRTVASVRRMAAFSLAPGDTRVVHTSCEYPDSDYRGHVRPEPWHYKQELVIAELDRTDSKSERLTANDVVDYYPAWSPDGRRIAFFQGAHQAELSHESVGAIRVIQADGSELQFVHGPELILGAPTWSPDGRWLAFVKDEGATQAGLYLADVDGGGIRRLSDTLSRPSWSPDSQHLAFARRDGDVVALVILTVETAVQRRVASIESEIPPAWILTVAWSPAGEHILYACGMGLCVVTPDGTRVGELPVKVQGAAWSPDGSRIAVVVASDAKFLPVHAVLVSSTVPDGSDLRPLVRESDRRELVAALPMDGDQPTDLGICDSEYVIYNPTEHPGLVRDCETLVGMRQALLGGVVLYWNRSSRLPIQDSWVGVAVSGTPPRITGLWLDRLNVPGRPGPLPPDLGELTQLQVLQLNHNQFAGPIPAELGQLTQLRDLNVASNAFTGSIPPELGQLTKLTRLDLRDNQLTGPIPAELGHIESLEVLLLGGNRLTGCIPLSLTSLELVQSDLDRLGLPECAAA